MQMLGASNCWPRALAGERRLQRSPACVVPTLPLRTRAGFCSPRLSAACHQCPTGRSSWRSAGGAHRQLEPKVQKPPRVTAVSAAPGVVVRGRLEVGTPEQRRNMIEDGAQQCMGGVGVAPAVVVVQLGDQFRQFPGIQADSLCPHRQAGADLWVNVTQAARGRTAGLRSWPSAERVNTTSPAA
jgi:hypothetical protein